MNDVQKNNKKQLSGKVLESKMKDTAVVRVVRRFPHPKYKKFINKSKKYYAHDPKNICKSGDLVKILESKPISKLKRWVVLSVEREAIK
tara:strand:- start:1328 stop:1594 length:267 start_codon:yes stop_codon:yes gene_type:complete